VHLLYEALALRVPCALPQVPGGPYASRRDAQYARLRIFGPNSGAAIASVADPTLGQRAPVDAVVGCPFDADRIELEGTTAYDSHAHPVVSAQPQHPVGSAPSVEPAELAHMQQPRAVDKALSEASNSSSAPVSTSSEAAVAAVSREFGRLYSLAIERAGSRASSAAVIDLARKWAVTKTRQWAVDVAGFTPDSVEMALLELQPDSVEALVPSPPHIYGPTLPLAVPPTAQLSAKSELEPSRRVDDSEPSVAASSPTAQPEAGETAAGPSAYLTPGDEAPQFHAEAAVSVDPQFPPLPAMSRVLPHTLFSGAPAVSQNREQLSLRPPELVPAEVGASHLLEDSSSLTLYPVSSVSNGPPLQAPTTRTFAGRRGSGVSVASTASSSGSLLPSDLQDQLRSHTRPVVVVKAATRHSFRVLDGDSAARSVPPHTLSASIPVPRLAQDAPIPRLGAASPGWQDSGPNSTLELLHNSSGSTALADSAIPDALARGNEQAMPHPSLSHSVTVAPQPAGISDRVLSSEHLNVQKPAVQQPVVQDEPQPPALQSDKALGSVSEQEGASHVGRVSDLKSERELMLSEEKLSWHAQVLRSALTSVPMILPVSNLFNIAPETRSLASGQHLHAHLAAPGSVAEAERVLEPADTSHAFASTAHRLQHPLSVPVSTESRPIPREASSISGSLAHVSGLFPPPRGVYAAQLQGRVVHVGLVSEPTASLPANAALCWSEPGTWPRYSGGVALSDVVAVNLRSGHVEGTGQRTGQPLLQLRLSPTRLPEAVQRSNGLLIVDLTPADGSDGAVSALREFAGRVSALHGRLLLEILAGGNQEESTLMRRSGADISPVKVSSTSFADSAAMAAVTRGLAAQSLLASVDYTPTLQAHRPAMKSTTSIHAPSQLSATGLSDTAARLLAARSSVTGAGSGALAQILSSRHNAAAPKPYSDKQ
jgi:hypothetical protein